MKRLALIVNPTAGGHRGLAEAERAKAAFETESIEVELHPTTKAGDATEFANRLAPHYDAIIAVGGDGTLAEVLAGVVDDHPDVVLGVVPVGTANVIARELKIPLGDSTAAARVLARSTQKASDWGRANGRPFLAVCGVNFDSLVVRRLDLARRRKRSRISMLKYIGIGLREIIGYRAPKLNVTADDEALDQTWSTAIVANTRNYGGIMSVSPDADMRDGALDLHCRRGRGRFAVVRHLAFALLRRRDSGRACLYRRCRRVRIESDHPVAVQIDGDYAGKTPLDVEMASRPVNLLVPEKTS